MARREQKCGSAKSRRSWLQEKHAVTRFLGEESLDSAHGSRCSRVRCSSSGASKRYRTSQYTQRRPSRRKMARRTSSGMKGRFRGRRAGGSSLVVVSGDLVVHFFFVVARFPRFEGGLLTPSTLGGEARGDRASVPSSSLLSPGESSVASSLVAVWAGDFLRRLESLESHRNVRAESGRERFKYLFPPRPGDDEVAVRAYRRALEDYSSRLACRRDSTQVKNPLYRLLHVRSPRNGFGAVQVLVSNHSVSPFLRASSSWSPGGRSTGVEGQDSRMRGGRFRWVSIRRTAAAP